MNVKIISEDTYGKEFFKKLIFKLNEIELVENIIVQKPETLPALCNYKLDRILKAIDTSCDKIIIIQDADGPQNKVDRYKRIKNHVPDDLITPVEIIQNDYEIEEWICVSMDLKWGELKPSKELKHKCGYIKSGLPKYAERLDFDKLIKNSDSFRLFLKALQE